MQKTALLVLDFINDIVDPKGKISTSAKYIEEYDVIEKANKVIEFARKSNISIVMVKVGFSENYLECPEISPIFGKAKQSKALQLNTWGTEFYEKLDVEPQDFVVIKHRISAFYSTALETFLRANQIQQVIICGVSTDMAVQTTAREAHDRDYKVVIVSDACAAASREINLNTLKSLERIANVTDSHSLDKVLS